MHFKAVQSWHPSTLSHSSTCWGEMWVPSHITPMLWSHLTKLRVTLSFYLAKSFRWAAIFGSATSLIYRPDGWMILSPEGVTSLPTPWELVPQPLAVQLWLADGPDPKGSGYSVWTVFWKRMTILFTVCRKQMKLHLQSQFNLKGHSCPGTVVESYF